MRLGRRTCYLIVGYQERFFNHVQYRVFEIDPLLLQTRASQKRQRLL